MSRLVYRKGADFLAVIIPEICSQFPTVDFIIGKFFVLTVHVYSACHVCFPFTMLLMSSKCLVAKHCDVLLYQIE